MPWMRQIRAAERRKVSGVATDTMEPDSREQPPTHAVPELYDLLLHHNLSKSESSDPSLLPYLSTRHTMLLTPGSWAAGRTALHVTSRDVQGWATRVCSSPYDPFHHSSYLRI